MKKVTLMLVIMAGSGLVWLVAQELSTPPTGSRPRTSNAQVLKSASPTSNVTATHTVGQVVASPRVLPVGVSQNVTMSATITDPKVIPASVNLLHLATNGIPTVVGQMASAGNGVYSLTIPLSLQSAGVSNYEVSAAFTGTLLRVLSAPTSVIALNVPSGFTVDTNALANQGPLSLNNFGSLYLSGGVIPQSGASIDATITPAPPPPLSDYITSVELQGATIGSTSSISVSGVSCTDVVYTDTFTSTLTYSNEAVYCQTGSDLYKFFLSFNAGDPNGAQYSATFHQFLSGAIL